MQGRIYHRKNPSRPARARGLKPVCVNDSNFKELSRPARARGLKPVCVNDSNFKELSRPARARGLKRKGDARLKANGNVAPRAGAWIETKDPQRL